MTLTQLAPPYPIFTDKNGSPLDNGYLYFGTVNLNPETNPITVYYDTAFTQPAAQPLRTSNGYVMRNGSPAIIYANSQFSVTVRDKKKALVIYSPVGYGVLPGTTASNTDQLTYNQGSTGAVNRVLTTRLQDFVSVKDFGAVGNGVANDTAAIQAAINSGKPIVFPQGTYLSGPLTQATTGQRFYADGQVTIAKNANGTLFTATGAYVELNGLQFVGSGFTGDNIDISGNHARLITCSSYGTPGVAARLRGSHNQIFGTSGSYTTTDTTANGYDIVIGTDGVATLYHDLSGIYTSQANGGIKFIDTGAHTVIGGQFGKITVTRGSSGYIAGCNAGQFTGCRVNGVVSIEQSNGSFSACQFSGTTVTIGSGTTGVNFDVSNIFSSATTFVNSSGNFNSIQLGNAYDGASPFVNKLGLGDSSSLAWLGYEPATGRLYTSSNIYAGYNSNATVYAGGVANAGGIYGGSGGLYLGTSYAARYQATDTTFRPVADNACTLGSSGQRWSVVYAATGAINTSDASVKQQVRDLSDVERAVALKCKSIIKAYKFNDAVAEKNSAARWHFGIVAQDVAAAFALQGLDANAYGLFCHDEWPAQDEVLDADGNVVVEAKAAGNRYGIRYDELAMFILGAI
jgi:hypothetical protein